MKERETTIQSSIWERLTPDKALEWAERILYKIEEGKLKGEIYEHIADRLIEFACKNDGENKFPDSQIKQDNFPNNKCQNLQKSKANKTFHPVGLNQLPLPEKALYIRRRTISRSIFAANKNGRVRVKNKKRRY